MAENINISFAPNKNADESQRIADIENYLQTLTERTKFAFSTIIEDYGESATSDSNTHAISGLSKLTNAVIYNDPVIVSKNTAEYLQYNYSVVGYSDSEDAITYAQDGKSSIIAQGYSACPFSTNDLGTEHGDLYFINGIYGSDKDYKTEFDRLHFYIKVSEIDNQSIQGIDSDVMYYLFMYNEYYTKDGETIIKKDNTTPYKSPIGDFTIALKWERIYPPTEDFPYGRARLMTGVNYSRISNSGEIIRDWASGNRVDVSFSSIDEYNAAVKLTKSSTTKQSVSQTTIKSENYDSSANLPEIGEPETIYTTTEPAAVWRYDSINKKYVCVGRDYNEINQIKSDIYGTDEVNVMKLPVRQLTKSSEEWEADSTIYPRGMMLIAQDLETEFGRRNSAIRIANGIDTWADLSDTNFLPIATSTTIGGVKIGDNIAVADDGTISVDLSSYLQSADIAEWAKQPEKPVYTAAEVGAAEAVHTHSDISAISLSGQTVDIDTLTASQTANKGKLMRYYCSVASAQNITNRPTTVNEPFTLEVRNIRWASESSYISVQRYISTSGKREYLRWCTNGTWAAWQATEIRTIYGTITQAESKSYSYASYGVGYVRVKLTALYNTDSGANLVNIKAATLVSTSDFERTMLTVNGVSLVWKISAGGDVTLEVVGGSASFTYELQYFIN